MRVFSFSRPKGPGFGLNRGFYLTVLCCKGAMPTMLEILNPVGNHGAVEGFGAPLTGSTDKERLQQPLARGTYALATKDRVTVLRMLLMSRDEAGFQPESFLRSELAANIGAEMANRMRGTWFLAQFTFESHSPEVAPSLDFLARSVQRLALLTDGVVADPICQRYLLPEEVFAPDRLAPIDVREHVAVHARPRPEGLHVYSLGLRKFGLPELEIQGLTLPDRAGAESFLLGLGQSILGGKILSSGDRVGSAKMAFEVRDGGFDRSLWEGTPVFELLPPTSVMPGEAIAAAMQS